MDYDKLSAAERCALLARLEHEIRSNQRTEIDIYIRGRRDLVHFVVDVFNSIAAALGYAVALPFAIAKKIVKDIWGGFGRGWRSAWNKYS